jgi:hypothetical protein
MFLTMKKFEVSAYSLEEAKATAMNEFGIKVTQNVTQSWKNAGSPVSGKEFENFCVDILDKKRLTGVEGVGLVIAITPGSKDTRERPYKYKNVTSEGKRQMERVVEIRLKATDEVVGEAKNKSEAEKLAKKLMLTYKQDMVAVITYHVKDGKELAFELDYAPSQSAQKGRYIVFGNEKSGF